MLILLHFINEEDQQNVPLRKKNPDIRPKRINTLHTMNRRILYFALSAGTLSTFTSAASISVAIISDEPGAALSDVRGKLLSSGLFSTIDYFNMGMTTPTLSQLQQYASVLVYSGLNSYANPTLLGNNLADYVDGGGGVVQAVFSNASQPMAGRFAASPYALIMPSGQTMNENLTMQSFDPLHPIMTGVNTFNGGTGSYRSNDWGSGVTIASWSNGAPLVVVKDIGAARRVDLNFYPPSDAIDPRFWDQDTDGAILMANALSYAGYGAVIPEPTTTTMLLLVANIFCFGRTRRGFGLFNRNGRSSL